MKDYKKFKQGLEVLAATLGAQLNEATLRGYWVALTDEVSDESFAAAVRTAMKSCRFMPKPVELRELCGADGYGKAEQAWEYALKAARNCRASYDFEDKLVNACIRKMGGLRSLSMRKADDLAQWGRKEFLEHYSQLSKQQVDPRELEHTKGTEEIEGPGTGHQVYLLGPKEEDRRRLLLAAKEEDGGEGLDPDEVDWGIDAETARKAFFENIDKIGKVPEDTPQDSQKTRLESFSEDNPPPTYREPPKSFVGAFARLRRRHEQPYSVFDLSSYDDSEKKSIVDWMSAGGVAWFADNGEKIRVEWPL